MERRLDNLGKTSHPEPPEANNYQEIKKKVIKHDLK